MNKITYCAITLFSFLVNGQQMGSVGINTETPQATLHVVGNPKDTSSLDGIIPPKMTGDELAAKNYTSSQTGAFVYVTTPATSLTGQVINVTTPDHYFFNGTIWQSLTPTLFDVVNRGNWSPRYISFTGDSNKQGTPEAALGVNYGTGTFYFSSINQNQSGDHNTAFGYEVFSKLSTGAYNSSFGNFSGGSLTTGNWNTLLGTTSGWGLTTGSYNTLIGENAGRSFQTTDSNTIIGAEASYNSLGFKNTVIGVGSGYWDNTGNLNAFIGYKAANGNRWGNNNLMIGNYAGGRQQSTLGVGNMGSNNVFIGTGAGYNNTGISNKLIIHSNSSLTGFSNTSEGNFTTNDGKIEYALITGDFSERWFKLNGALQVSPTYIKTADSTYNKILLYNNTTGDIGISSTVSVPSPPATGNYILKSINGVMQWVSE